ncbi:hypothetical protein DPMN_131909 [Dreissena polymorpha]|uniref:Uncharacterized protein n=1 Tax=Dreissena polymorpha TaxID=45954 RepID=A0A9D4JCN7_DREPO|nr:hypothetical protein DPMN_131909 [Dreissena polymorpha]
MRVRILKLFAEAKQKLISEAKQFKTAEVKRIANKRDTSSKIKEEIHKVLSMCRVVLERGTPNQQYIYLELIKEKQKTMESNLSDQKKITFEVVNVSFPKELTSLLEMGSNCIKLDYGSNKKEATSPMILSSQPMPVNLELLVSVDLHKTGDDKEEPLLSGLDFLPDGRLVAVDNYNWKCIILNERLQRLGTPYKFKDHPNGVVCVSHDTLCVTGGGEKVVCLLSVSTDNTITLTREIKTSSQFDSICCMSPSNMVVSTYDDPRPARMISVDGVESDFDHFLTFPKKKYKVGEIKCTYVQSKNTLVLTDQLAHTVYMYDTVNGTSRAVTNENIQNPLGACVGPDDTVLVCSGNKDSIVHLTIHGKILCTYPLEMKTTYSICVSKDGTSLAVSNCRNGFKKIHLYKLSMAIS